MKFSLKEGNISLLFSLRIKTISVYKICFFLKWNTIWSKCSGYCVVYIHMNKEGNHLMQFSVLSNRKKYPSSAWKVREKAMASAVWFVKTKIVGHFCQMQKENFCSIINFSRDMTRGDKISARWDACKFARARMYLSRVPTYDSKHAIYSN